MFKNKKIDVEGYTLRAFNTIIVPEMQGLENRKFCIHFLEHHQVFFSSL